MSEAWDREELANLFDVNPEMIGSRHWNPELLKVAQLSGAALAVMEIAAVQLQPPLRDGARSFSNFEEALASFYRQEVWPAIRAWQAFEEYEWEYIDLSAPRMRARWAVAGLMVVMAGIVLLLTL